MQFTPYKHQEYAIQRIIAQPELGLFLDMGMGKTVCTLTAIESLKYDYCAVNKVLVIAPIQPAKNVWPKEISKWDHLSRLTYVSLCGTKQNRVEALKQEADIYIINRDNIVWLVNYLKASWPFDMIVIDELSSFKSASSQRFRALKKVRKYTQRVVGLTGTPAANGYIGLWSQCFLLDGGKALGKTLTGYRDQFFVPDKRGPNNIVYSWKLKPKAQEQIWKDLSGLCLSMKSEDYIDLPETMKICHVVKLPDEIMELYKTFKRDSLIEFLNLYAATPAVLSNKLLQFADGFVYDEEKRVIPIHTQKLEALEYLIEAANGQPVLVFYAFLHEKTRIETLYPEAVDIRAPNAVERWNKGEISILLANPASAGHGLNLQYGGHIIIWFGMTWDLELYDQANRRLSRPGQKHNVKIFHILCDDLLDYFIYDKVLTKKSFTQSSLLDALKAHLEG